MHATAIRLTRRSRSLLQHLDDRAAVGDLVVEDDDVLAVDVADDRVDHDAVVAQALLAAGGHRQPEHAREVGRCLRVAEIRRDDDGVLQVLPAGSAAPAP